MPTLKRKNANGQWEYIQVSGLDVSQLKDEVDSNATALAESPSYPSLTGEIGVVNKKYHYGNVRRYGALGDGTTDDSGAFQKAIDNAYTNGWQVFVPVGKYLINQTIYLPAIISIRGENVPRNLKLTTFSETEHSSIISGTNILFKGKNIDITADNASTVQVQFENLYFKWNGNVSSGTISYLFHCITHSSSYIRNIAVDNFGVIFYGSIKYVSVIKDNQFRGIYQYFIDGSVIAGGLTQAEGQVVDSFITHNYISANSNALTPVTLFNLNFPAHSIISENFIEFAKYAFYLVNGGTAMQYNNNIIDYCYRGFYKDVKGQIKGNKFSKCNSTDALGFYSHPTSDMQTATNWWCIELSGNYLQLADLQIQNNVTFQCKYFLKAQQPCVKNITVTGNAYDSYILTKVDYKTWISNAGWVVSNVYIDELMYQSFTTLPNPTLTSTNNAPGITTFNNQQIYYNNKLVRNNNEQWMDMMGTVVT